MLWVAEGIQGLVHCSPSSEKRFWRLVRRGLGFGAAGVKIYILWGGGAVDLRVPLSNPILIVLLPRGSIYTTCMELGRQNHTRHGLLRPNCIMVEYVDPNLNPIEPRKEPSKGYWSLRNP